MADSKIITPVGVKRCKHCSAEKTLSEFYKHKRMADGRINVCKPCRDAYVKSWTERNSARSRELKDAACARWRAKRKIEGRDYLHTENVARWRVVDKRAIPAWSNQFFVEEAYELAQHRSQVTGREWTVDHIVPLNSPLVCGLHCHTNLAVIPFFNNRSKRNRHWPDMP